MVNSTRVGVLTLVITHDCEGSGQCVLVANDLLRLDDDGFAESISPEADVAFAHQALEAAGLCPTGAIRIVEDQGTAGVTVVKRGVET